MSAAPSLGSAEHLQTQQLFPETFKTPRLQVLAEHPVLQRLSRLMEESDTTDADSEALELALLDVELSRFAADEGIHLPPAAPSPHAPQPAAASPSRSRPAGQQAQPSSSFSRQQQQTQHQPVEPSTLQQLVQQQSKFLEVLQNMLQGNGGTSGTQYRTSSNSSSSVAQSHQVAPTSAVGATATGPESPAAGSHQLDILQVQYERQLADNHSLKKRCLKVQKAMLRHLQAARMQAAAAEAACQEARRREQQASTAATTLQLQLVQQQQTLHEQQQQLTGMREQLLQVKELHKKKLARYKAQLQQQFEAQLAAATATYTQELSLLQAMRLASAQKVSGGGSSTSSAGGAPRQVSKKPRPSLAATAAALPPAPDSPTAATATVPAATAHGAAVIQSPSSSSSSKPAGGRASLVGGTSDSKGSTKASVAAAAAAAQAPAEEITDAGLTTTVSAVLPADDEAALSNTSSQEMLTPEEVAAAAAVTCLAVAELCGPGTGTMQEQSKVQQHKPAGNASDLSKVPAAVQQSVRSMVEHWEGQLDGADGLQDPISSSSCPDASTETALATVPTVLPPAAMAALQAAGPVEAMLSPQAGGTAVAVAQQLQSHLLLLLAQQLAEHLPPDADGGDDADAIFSLQQSAEQLLQQPQQQRQRQRQHGSSGELNVPDEVVRYAQHYQQGGEGSSRPPSATPSVLQRRRQQRVPEAAAQLAQHFVAGGEGTSRPLTAPSSDRSRAMQQHRTSSPSAHGRASGMCNEHPAVQHSAADS